MASDRPKVLHRAAGRTLLQWVLDASGSLDPEETVVVVGYQAQEVIARLPDGAVGVIQDPQNGTGDAARVGLGALTQEHETIVVLPGDMPLVQPMSLSRLVVQLRDSGAAASILTVELQDPHGYGRIIRSGDGVGAIVEERDATPAQREITEVNTSVYAFDGEFLANAVGRINSRNDQGEYYLTDVLGILVEDGHDVVAVVADPQEGLGVNSHAQLAEAARALRSRVNERLMDSGVWMLDPGRVYIDAGVAVAPGSEIYPDTYLTGDTTIGAAARIGPSVQIHDSTVGDRAVVVNAVLDAAIVGADVSVGPYAYLRPGAVLKDGSKAGAYVEIKNSEVGARSKVPHLSYIGDATIGEDTNIGAATITVNYDGFEKYRVRHDARCTRHHRGRCIYGGRFRYHEGRT